MQVWKSTVRASLIVAGAMILAQTAGALTIGGPANAPIKFKYGNHDTGALYNPQAIFPVGATGGPGPGLGYTAPNVAAVDAIEVVSPAGPAVASEDAWGIAKVTSIERYYGGGWNTVWNDGDGGEELTAYLYGLEDFGVDVTPLGEQVIDSAGVILDMYVNTSGTYFTNLDPNGIGGVTQAEKDAVLNSITGGTPWLKLIGEPGHMNMTPVGPIAGGFDTEYQGTYNFEGIGTGKAYLSVQTGWGDPMVEAMFDTNTIIGGNVAPEAIDPALWPTANPADFRLQFTTASPTQPGWLVSSEDPLRGVGIPEPTASLSLLLIAGIGLIRRRRRS